ncbi:MAG: hypothetical protein PVSMB2_27690 [Ktedonobacteraceae bacterium]
MPDGPYDIWRDGDTAHRVKDLTFAFAQFAQLPKMLNRGAILKTLLKGCQDGLFVLESRRGDGSKKTYWFEAPEEALAAKDDTLQVIFSQYASLSELPARLLSPDVLPSLWPGPELTLRNVYTYFACNPTVQMQREKFSDDVVIPKAERSVVDAAIQTAVKEKRLWLLAGRASLYAEDVPADVLREDATLQAPPQPIHAREVMPDALPEAWNGQAETTALAISDALATKLGKVLPWAIVREAIDGTFKARWLERTPMKAAVDAGISFKIRIELGTKAAPSTEAVDQINKLLQDVSKHLKLM